VKDLSDGQEISRREFVAVCSLLAAGLTACATVTDRTRIGAAFIIDPPPTGYMPVLRDLIRLILPFEHLRFPLTAEQVERRLLQMFPLEEERQFLGLQRTLVFFNELELIHRSVQVFEDEERKAADCPIRISSKEFRRLWRDKLARESGVFSDFVDRQQPHVRRFTDLDARSQREYFDLWCNSELLIKREFASGLRYLVMVTAYSDERVWRAIGYEGPFVPRVRESVG
jgi:hypothetical protein